MPEDELLAKIGRIAEQIQQLAADILPELSEQVYRIIATQSKDAQEVERLWDSLCDWAIHDDRILALFKRLCRYWIRIDPETTFSYIQDYREMTEDN